MTTPVAYTSERQPVHVRALDVLRSMRASGFAAPASVPREMVCAGEIIATQAKGRVVFVELKDASGATFNVKLKRSQTRAPDGTATGMFPSVS